MATKNITFTNTIITDLREQLERIKDITRAHIDLNFDSRELALGTVNLQHGKKTE